MQRIILWALIMIFTAMPVMAADETIKIKEVVVTATKIEEAVEKTTSSVVVVTAEEIKSKNAEFVVEVLATVPEINLVQNGGQGKVAQVFLRGAEPSQVLVMIDGIKVKSTTTGAFDFSGIAADDIDRIEIVKGPQSTIYGSEAIGGVINIITKRGQDKTGTDLILKAGSYGTYEGSASVSGGSGLFDYRVTTSYHNTDGISVAKGGDEEDGYKNAAVSTKIGIKPSDKLNLEITGRYYYDRSELDDYDYLSRKSIDALNYVQQGNHLVLSAKANLYLYDKWEQVLILSRVEDTLKVRDTDIAWNNYDIITSLNTVDWQNNLYISDSYILTAGVEYREESGENKGVFDKNSDNRAVYLNNFLKLFDERLVLNAGIRLDDNESFGEHSTYRVGALYTCKKTGIRTKASYGTGFSAPAFNELFFPNYGNPDLEPEESSAWEAGLEKDFFDRRLALSLTYFEQDYENLIQTDPMTWTAVNVGRAEVDGIEIGASVKVTEDLILKSAYTHLDTEDKDTGQRLTRRPDNKLNITAGYSAGSLSVLAGYTYVGDAYDTSAGRNLDAYSLVNLSGSYKAHKNIRLFARIDNLLDEDYETAGGFNTPGISGFAGVKFEM